MMDTYKRLDDIGLFELIANREDPKALSELYDRHWEKMYAIAIKILKSSNNAEDIVHDVFLSIWNKKETLTQITNPRAYLLQSIKFQIFKHFRHQKIRSNVYQVLKNENDEVPPVYFNEKKFIDSTMDRIITKLPEKSKEVFIMSRLNSFSYKEIALKLEISTKTVERHMNIALKKIRQVLKTEELTVLIISTTILFKNI